MPLDWITCKWFEERILQWEWLVRELNKFSFSKSCLPEVWKINDLGKIWWNMVDEEFKISSNLGHQKPGKFITKKWEVSKMKSRKKNHSISEFFKKMKSCWCVIQVRTWQMTHYLLLDGDWHDFYKCLHLLRNFFESMDWNFVLEILVDLGRDDILDIEEDWIG